MAATFDLIIFDCDGVLVDSEVISTHTLLDILATPCDQHVGPRTDDVS